MFTSTSNPSRTDGDSAGVLIPLIRAAATVGFAIAPCSLGFVIIAVSEHLIRSIIVGDDPEMLVSEVQNQFPNNALKVKQCDDDTLVAKVVHLIENADQNLELPLETRAAGTTVDYTFLAEHIGAVRAGVTLI